MTPIRVTLEWGQLFNAQGAPLDCGSHLSCLSCSVRCGVTLLPWYAWTMGGRGLIDVQLLTQEQFVAR